MEGKHEWQVSMILHWPQNLSTSMANQYKFEFFSWRFTLFLGSVYRDTLVSVNRYVSWPPNIGAPRCTGESRHPYPFLASMSWSIHRSHCFVAQRVCNAWLWYLFYWLRCFVASNVGNAMHIFFFQQTKRWNVPPPLINLPMSLNYPLGVDLAHQTFLLRTVKISNLKQKHKIQIIITLYSKGFFYYQLLMRLAWRLRNGKVITAIKTMGCN